MSNSSKKTRKLAIYAMFIALAYVVMLVGRFPISVLPFLKTDPKDAVIVIAGFIFGPFAAVIISAITSLIEMVTVSETGPIGLLMNVLSTCAFACPAAAIYKKKHNMGGAVAGLATGVVLMTAVMLLWNYLITPLYMDTTRADVAAKLVPIFLPFNLLKGGINAGLALLVYKPVVSALRKAKLLEQTTEGSAPAKKRTLGMALLGVVLLATCILIVLAIKGII
ncbi:MAG: ECF transporter S component [Clostridia bacterium]|nr:ECF transporter S component [Clostridia bacterium]